MHTTPFRYIQDIYGNSHNSDYPVVIAQYLLKQKRYRMTVAQTLRSVAEPLPALEHFLSDWIEVKSSWMMMIATGAIIKQKLLELFKV